MSIYSYSVSIGIPISIFISFSSGPGFIMVVLNPHIHSWWRRDGGLNILKDVRQSDDILDVFAGSRN